METAASGLREYRVRDFAAEDLGEVQRLVYHTIDACYRAVYPLEAIEYFREYHSEAHILEDARNGYTLVLEIQGQIVGTGTLLGTNVRRVFIHPSCQHLGFGKLVMRMLQQRAVEEGVGALDLSSSIISKRFYDRLGYVAEEEDHVPLQNGGKLTFYVMAKRLDDAVLIIRAESGNRLAEVRALCEQYAASLDFDLHFQGFEQEMASLPGDYAPPCGCLLLARRRGEPVGCVAVRCLENRICEMKRLYVRPECRGQGIGRMLAREAVDEARRIGYERIRLDTAPRMKEARALYRSLGFRPIPPYCHNPLPGALYLELKIAEGYGGAS
jgi:putative acetyltransferase